MLRCNLSWLRLRGRGMSGVQNKQQSIARVCTSNCAAYWSRLKAATPHNAGYPALVLYPQHGNNTVHSAGYSGLVLYPQYGNNDALSWLFRPGAVPTVRQQRCTQLVIQAWCCTHSTATTQCTQLVIQAWCCTHSMATPQCTQLVIQAWCCTHSMATAMHSAGYSGLVLYPQHGNNLESKTSIKEIVFDPLHGMCDSLSLSHTHTDTHSLTHTHTLTCTHTHMCTNTHTLTHTEKHKRHMIIMSRQLYYFYSL